MFLILTPRQKCLAVSTSFNQDIGDWNVANARDFNGFLNESGMSTYNYEQLLINWNDSLDLTDNLNFHAVVLNPSDPMDTIGIKYRLRAQPARDSIITNELWTIYDGGLIGNRAPFVSSGLPDIVLKEGFASQVLNTRLDTVFKDDDGDPLVFSAISLDGSVIGSMVRGNDSLVLNEISTSLNIIFDTIVVTAMDMFGDEVKDTFTVTVLPSVYFDSSFVTTWHVSAGDSISIPTGNGITSAYDFDIDWGDGFVSSYVGKDLEPIHKYVAGDTFTVQIKGIFPHINLGSGTSANAENLLSIEQWGNIAWESMDSAFSGATNLELNATDTPNLSGVKSMSAMFAGASKFNGDLSGWKVDSVTDMTYVFEGATSFNQDIGTWNVAKASFMSGMFSGATSFNQDIGGWNVAKASFMSGMFSGATSFNQDIGGWNVAKASFMSSMFSGATSFNQDIGGWNVVSVNSMDNMFSGATSFNQDIGGWNVANVLDFNGFLNESGMSTYNYEELLINWNASLDLADNLNFHAVVLNPSDPTDTIGIKYRLRAEPSRDSIITNDLWTIYDGGLIGNRAPFVSSGLPDIVLREGFTSQTLSTRLDTVFKDDDGDPLTFSAVSLDGSVIGSIVRSNDSLVLNELSISSDIVVDTIVLTATDILGAESKDTFVVTIENVAPRVVNPLSDLILKEGFGNIIVEVSDAFRDLGTLVFSATNTAGVVSTSIIGSDLTIIGGSGLGVDSIIVTASDGKESVSDTFKVTVIENIILPVLDTLSDLILNEGFKTHKIYIGKVFGDLSGIILSHQTDPVDVVLTSILGDTLTLTEQGVGETFIILTRSDARGIAIDTFTVFVNSLPKLVSSIQDMFWDKGFGTASLDLSKFFSDKETSNKDLSFTAISNPENVVGTSISGNTLTLSEQGTGPTLIIITVDDGMGGEATAVFTVVVRDIVTGIAQDDKSISIYPNPFTDLVYVDLGILEGVSIQVYTPQGYVIHEEQDLSGGIHVLDLPDTSKGVLFVEIVSTDVRKIFKLVRE